MAERVVLAQFEVDTRGVVTGIRGAEAATTQAARKMGGALDAFTTKAFSARTAALRLGAAFGFGGIVFTAANAVAQLVRDVVSSTSAFQRAATAVGDWYAAVIKGEDAAQRLSARVSGVAGLDALNKIRDKMKEIATLEAAISAGPNATRPALGTSRMGRSGSMGVVFTSASDTGARAAFEGATAGIVKAREELNALVLTANKAGISMEAIAQATGATFDASLVGITEFDLLTEQLLTVQMEERWSKAEEAAKKHAEAIRKEVEELSKLSVAGRNPILEEEFIFQQTGATAAEWAGLEERKEMFSQLNYEASLLQTTLDGLAPPQDTSPWDEWKDSVSQAAETVALKVELAAAAFSGFVNIISRGLTQGGLSFKSFLADMLAALVPVLVAWGAAAIIEGWVTHNGALIAQGFIAFGAAAAAGAASRALGGGKSYTGSGGGRRWRRSACRGDGIIRAKRHGHRSWFDDRHGQGHAGARPGPADRDGEGRRGQMMWFMFGVLGGLLAGWVLCRRAHG